MASLTFVFLQRVGGFFGFLAINVISVLFYLFAITSTAVMIRIVIVRDSWCTRAGVSLDGLTLCLLDRFCFLPQIEVGAKDGGCVSLSLPPQCLERGIQWALTWLLASGSPGMAEFAISLGSSASSGDTRRCM